MVSEVSAPRVSLSFCASPPQIVVLAALMVAALASGVGVAALIVRVSPVVTPSMSESTAHRQALPLLPAMKPDSLDPVIPAPRQAGSELPASASSRAPARGDIAEIVLPPRANRSPLLRPLASSPQLKGDVLPPLKDAPLPPTRPLVIVSPSVSPAGPFDRWTAVYDLTAHKVYMPGGVQLEAHSGLGDRLDDPRYVYEPDRGATPPHLYDLTMREGLFHGVQALRLNPIGGESAIFGRVGLLAHPYMLGAHGDSNGCVSFKDYDAFLAAFQSGRVKRLAVVASLS